MLSVAAFGRSPYQNQQTERGGRSSDKQPHAHKGRVSKEPGGRAQLTKAGVTAVISSSPRKQSLAQGINVVDVSSTAPSPANGWGCCSARTAARSATSHAQSERSLESAGGPGASCSPGSTTRPTAARHAARTPSSGSRQRAHRSAKQQRPGHARRRWHRRPGGHHGLRRVGDQRYRPVDPADVQQPRPQSSSAFTHRSVWRSVYSASERHASPCPVRQWVAQGSTASAA